MYLSLLTERYSVSALSYFREVKATVSLYLHRVAVEGFATLTGVIPCTFWWGLKRISKQVQLHSTLSVTAKKTKITAEIYLYSPSKIEKGKEYHPVLFVGGDYSFPWVNDHLAEVAQEVEAQEKNLGLICTLHVPSSHRDDYFNNHCELVDLAIERIEKIVTDAEGVFKGIYAVGHSKGAMLLAHRQFSAEKDPKIARTFAIAGPLRVTESATCFGTDLTPIFEELYPKIVKHIEQRPIVQIVGSEDYNADRTITEVDQRLCFEVEGMHLSVLFEKETKRYLKEFLSRPLETMVKA